MPGTAPMGTSWGSERGRKDWLPSQGYPGHQAWCQGAFLSTLPSLSCFLSLPPNRRARQGHKVKVKGGCTLWMQVLNQAERCPPPTQVLHFFVGFGALLSPLIADPFLSEANCFPANSTANASSRSHLFHASRVLGQHQATTQPWSNQTIPGPSPKDSTENHVSYAFWIMALINVSVTGAGRVGSWRGGGNSTCLPVQLPSAESSNPRNMPGTMVCSQKGEVACRNHLQGPSL